MKKLWRYLLEFSIALAIVLLLVRVYNLYENSKLSDRPFDPTVWGNVSDWFMVVVTIITATFLVKTFREQRKINDITFSNHRKSIMPKLELESGTTPLSVIDAGVMFLKLSDNELYNLNVQLKSNDFQNIQDNFTLNMIPTEAIALVVGNMNPFYIGTILCVELLFEDCEGNKYDQRLFKNRYGAFRLTPPRFIRDTY